MKKKLLVLVAMLLCVVTVLASCASSMKFEKVVGDGTYNDENPTLTTAAKVDVKGEKVNAKGDLVVFKDTTDGLDTWTVYNLATGATAWTATETKTEAGATTTEVDYLVNLYTYDDEDVSWFKVTTTTTTVTTVENGPNDEDTKNAYSLRDAKGTEFATSNSKTATVVELLDLIRFDGKVYRIAKDGTIAYAFDLNDFAAMPAVTQKVGDYYYKVNVLEEEEGLVIANAISVYNSNLELVAHHTAHSEVSYTTYHILNNGNVLFQYMLEESDTTEDYDLKMDGGYVTVQSYLINVETGKVKELNLDFAIWGINARQSDADQWIYDEKVENLAIVTYFEDERMDYSATAKKLVSLSNKGKVNGEVNLIDNQAPEMPKLVANNRWIVSDLAGNKFLLNEEGEVMANVTAMTNYNASFIMLNGKIYDWDLNVKYDMAENDVTVKAILDHGVLMTNDDGETLIYANGEVKTLINKDNKDKQTLLQILTLDTYRWVEIDQGEYEELHAEDPDQVRMETPNQGNNYEWVYEKRVRVVTYSDDVFVIVKTADDGKVTYDVCNDIGAVLTTINASEVTMSNLTAYVATAASNNAMLFVGDSVPTETEPTSKPVYYRVG